MHKELKKCLEEKHTNKELLKTKIEFFQHERLIHLIVTFFTGIATILFLLGFIITEELLLVLLFIISFLLFVPYIFHYYYLENGIQKLYQIYYKLEK